MPTLKVKYMNKSELMQLREELIKKIANAADRISLIDSRLAIIRSNELEADLIQAKPVEAMP